MANRYRWVHYNGYVEVDNTAVTIAFGDERTNIDRAAYARGDDWESHLTKIPKESWICSRAAIMEWPPFPSPREPLAEIPRVFGGGQETPWVVRLHKGKIRFGGSLKRHKKVRLSEAGKHGLPAALQEDLPPEVVQQIVEAARALHKRGCDCGPATCSRALHTSLDVVLTWNDPRRTIEEASLTIGPSPSQINCSGLAPHLRRPFLGGRFAAPSPSQINCSGLAPHVRSGPGSSCSTSPLLALELGFFWVGTG